MTSVNRADRRRASKRGRLLWVLVLLACGCFSSKQAVRRDLVPPIVSPELALDLEKSLSPGLSVRYFYGFFRNINQLPKSAVIRKQGIIGKPILKINHRFGKGEVFESGRSQGVGFEMTGYLRLPESGTYAFQVNSNDGIRVFLGNNLIIDDPRYHADRLSEPGAIMAESAGFYPVRILYFQRKGTATLEMFWKKPASEEFVIVPAEVYAHIARSPSEAEPSPK